MSVRTVFISLISTTVFFCALYVLFSLSNHQFARPAGGLFQLLLAVFLPFAAWRLYASERPRQSGQTDADSTNLVDRCELDAVEVMVNGLLAEPGALTSAGLLIGVVESQLGQIVFRKLGLGDQEVIAALRAATPTVPDTITQVLETVVKRTESGKRNLITVGDLLIALAQTDRLLPDVLFSKELTVDDLVMVVEFTERLLVEVETRRRWFERRQWKHTGGFARDFAAGYTITLDRYGQDLTELFSTPWLRLYGHEKELGMLERTLSKSSSANALLVGEPGSGRETIVLAVAEKIATGITAVELNHKHLVKLDIGTLLAGGSKEEIESRLVQVFNEASRSGNTILYIPEIHNLFGGAAQHGANQVGTVEASQLLLPFLQGNIQIIGSTDFAEFHRLIEPNSSIKDLFEKVEVGDLAEPDIIRICLDATPSIETRHQLEIGFGAIKTAVTLAGRYLHEQAFPEKAIKLLDEAAIAVSSRGGKLLSSQDVTALVSQITKVPVGEAKGEEAKKLLDLEAFMHQRVVGQEEAIKAVSEAMRRSRAGIREGNRPVGSFLFLGPTGVGKTETAKALASAYFGSEEQMIRLDMSEYQEQAALDRLIGPANDPSVAGGVLTRAVRENPFSLVLLDELEKANQDLLTLFLQVLDEGRLTDNTGRTVDFTNCIIIATSNAGSELIREHFKQGGDPSRLKPLLLDYLQTKGIFKPEFINRFDAVVSFEPLSIDQVVQIVEMMLNNLDKRLKEKEITVKVSDEAKQKIAQIGFDPVFGARPLRRMIQEKVENVIAKKILEGKLPRGSSLQITAADITLPKAVAAEPVG